MATIEVLKKRFESFHLMYTQESRFQSFVEWPFREGCACTPEKMASAGFVHCPSDNEPDVAGCFYCLLELEGWEPDDNPHAEHVKRSPNCRFLTMKDFSQLTMAEFHNLEKDRLKIYLRKICHKKLACLREEMDKTLENIKYMCSKQYIVGVLTYSDHKVELSPHNVVSGKRSELELSISDSNHKHS